MLAGEFNSVLATAANGDESAFAQLWREMNPALLRYLRVLTKSQTLAEDVAAETWIDVARKLADFVGGEAAFRRWLFTIARNRAIDAFRAAQRAPVRLVGDDATLDRPDQYDTAASALDRMLTEQALALIATLPREQAEAIMLRVIAGLDVKDVAWLLGKRPGAVRVATHRGLRTLAARLRAAAPDEGHEPDLGFATRRAVDAGRV
jgi:RNA polymerase sigma-70 factor (ECF subfamily)